MFMLNPYRYGGGASNIKALLPCDGTNGSTVFSDLTGLHTWARLGSTTAISTAQSKFGGASVLIGSTTGAGTTNGISTPTHADFDYGTGDFMIGWWHYFTTLTNFQTAYDRGATNAGGLVIQTGNGDGKFIVYVSGAAIITEASAATVNTWEWHTLGRNAGTLIKTRGGTTTASAANSTNINNTFNCILGGNSTGAYATAGYMDDIIIMKGGYDSGLTTPPTGPLTYP